MMWGRRSSSSWMYLIDTLSVRASLNGYEDALQTLVTIRNAKIKMK